MKNRPAPKSDPKPETPKKAALRTRDVLDAVESINAVAALKLPVRTSFVVALNLKAVKDAVEVFKEQHKKVLSSHTVTDEAGNPVPVYAPENGPDGKPMLDEAGKPVIVRNAKGDVVNKLIPDQVHIDDPAAFRKDIEELLDIDISDDVVIRPVKLSELTGTLEPQHLTNILWMFVDDTAEKPSA